MTGHGRRAGGGGPGGPVVSVVVPTRDRPGPLRAAVEAVRAQTWPGRVETLVVHDGTAPDRSIEVDDGDRPVRVLANARAPGLAGTRNTGILAAVGDLVAFCDDDDLWLPAKLDHQVRRALAPDRPEMVTCAITVEFEGRRTDRLAGLDEVTHAHLLRSRMSMLHSSTVLVRRDVLTARPEVPGSGGLGLVDETVPGSQNEDWDLLLRASSRRPVAHVDLPLAVVHWGRTSAFARRWDTKVDSLHWMLERHPDLVTDRRGCSRVLGQIAFGEAARGRRRAGLRWAGRSLRRDPLQWRAVAALPVAAGLVRAETVLEVLHRHGRGV